MALKNQQRGQPAVDTEAVNVRMERPAISAVDDWRRAQSDMPTRPEAIRSLIEAGLKANRGAPATFQTSTAPMQVPPRSRW
jgi:hypothetical protein